MKPLLKAILNSYAEILFMQGLTVGLCLLLITCISPRLAISGLISVTAAYGFAVLVGLNSKFLQAGFYTYNPLLVGMSLGSILSLNLSSILFVSLSGVLTLLVSVLVGNALHLYFNLPPLSIPFVICASVCRMASLRYPELLIESNPYWFEIPPITAPIILVGFCKSLGAILFLPEFLVGAGLAIVIGLNSRIILMLGMLGYIVGTSFRIMLTGSYLQVYSDFANFNFILIAAAVGGVFLVPSGMSFVIAMLAVMMAAILMDAVTGLLSFMSLPVYTLPFNIVSLAVLYVVSTSENNFLPKKLGESPEKTLEYSLFYRWRTPISQRTLSLPFYGSWTVWQGFDDEWTHQGHWKYAYDFVIVNDEGKTHEHTGENLTDYGCYRKPVISPVRGRVIKVVDHLPDNPLGTVDKTNNWGNLVLIEDWRGFYVELSHLATQSIKVKEGDWVEVGTMLGLCGNSGYSPQPHLHVQVQATANMGSYTLPFSFVNYVSDAQFHANDLPVKGKQVETLILDTGISAKTDFILDETYRYEVTKSGLKQPEIKHVVRMAIDGTFYFESESGERIYFGKHSGTFLIFQVEGDNPVHKAFAVALSQFPLSSKPGISWKHYLPGTMFSSGRTKLSLLRLAGWLFPESLKTEITSVNQALHRVEFKAQVPGAHSIYQGAIEFGESKGFHLIESGDFIFRRISDD